MNKEHAWRVLEYQRSQAIAHWDGKIVQWQKEKAAIAKEEQANSESKDKKC